MKGNGTDNGAAGRALMLHAFRKARLARYRFGSNALKTKKVLKDVL